MHIRGIIFILITLVMIAEIRDLGLEVWSISLALDFSQVKAMLYYQQ